MNIEIRREDERSIAAYAGIPSQFEIREVVDLAAVALGTTTVRVHPVPLGRKDYDAQPGNSPLSWHSQFKVRHWTFLAAYASEARVGGAVLVVRPESVAELGGRPQFAVLWDLRVAPTRRRAGIARALLAAAEATARAAGCDGIDVETQDNNVPACRLYASSGFALNAVTRNAYPELPNESRMRWTRTCPHGHSQR